MKRIKLLSLGLITTLLTGCSGKAIDFSEAHYRASTMHYEDAKKYVESVSFELTSTLKTANKKEELKIVYKYDSNLENRYYYFEQYEKETRDLDDDPKVTYLSHSKDIYYVKDEEFYTSLISNFLQHNV
jgi:hypothetical protein